MTLSNDEIKDRLLAIESKLNDISIALSNVPNKRMVNALTQITQKEIDDLQSQIGQIANVSAATELATHEVNPSAHLELDTRYSTQYQTSLVSGVLRQDLTTLASEFLSTNPLAVTLSSLVNDAGNKKTTIQISTNLTLGTTSLTIPNNIDLLFVSSGLVTLVSGQNLTINGGINTPPTRQIFSADFNSLVTTLEPVVYPEWWGAKGDNTTDDIIPIQQAINSFLYGAHQGRVRLLSKKYKITDTIQLGYGDQFIGVILEGVIYNPGGNLGSTLCPTFSDRPAINVQGGRGTQIRELTIWGLLNPYIQAHNLAFTPDIDDTNPDNWNDPTLASTQDSRYAPYAGISIDGYSGTKPATSYPIINYPNYTGITTQYEKLDSSDTLIENCFFIGLNTAIVVKPSNENFNADFTCIRRVNMEFCKYGISVCDQNSRGVHIEDVKGMGMYCMLTNNTHGIQQGTFNGTIDTLNLAEVIQIFKFGSTSFTLPITFLNCYAEGLWRIGDISFGTSSETSLIFQSCCFSFDLQTLARGIPSSVLGDLQSNGQTGNIQFNGSLLEYHPSVLGFSQYGMLFQGTAVYSKKEINAESEPLYMRYARNSTCDGVIMPAFGRAFGPAGTANYCDHRIKFNNYNTDTGASSWSVITGTGYAGASRLYCSPLYSLTTSCQNDYSSDFSQVTRVTDYVLKTSLTNCVLSGTTLTCQLPFVSWFNYETLGPGDLIWDDNNGMVFVISSVSGHYFIQAEAQNNFKTVNGQTSTLTPFSTISGGFMFGYSRFFTPSDMIIGTVTSGSNIISNCQRMDGINSFIPTEIKTGDWLYCNPYSDNNIPIQSAQVQSVEIVSGVCNITLNGNATRTEQHKRLDVWIKKTPDNFV